MRDKGIAMAGTLLFLAAVKTNAEPTLWQVGLVAVGMYEAMLLAVKVGRDVAKERRRQQNRRYRKRDGRRWAEEWFNPYKEVKF